MIILLILYHFYQQNLNDRPTVDSVLGGDFNNKTWFRGEGSIFGGAIIHLMIIYHLSLIIHPTNIMINTLINNQF